MTDPLTAIFRVYGAKKSYVKPKPQPSLNPVSFSLSWAQLLNTTSCWGQAKLSFDIPFLFKPQPCSDFAFVTVQAEPAQQELFDSSQLKLKSVWYTLIWKEINN